MVLENKTVKNQEQYQNKVTEKMLKIKPQIFINVINLQCLEKIKG